MAILLTVLMLIAGTASALDYSVSATDPQGDTQGQLTNSDVDITSISSEKSGDDLVLTMEVAGDINEGSKGNHYTYQLIITESESKDPVRLNRVLYEDGDATYRINGGAEQDLPTTPSVSGNTLEMRVPESAYSDLTSFHLYAETTYAEHQGGDTYQICTDEALGWSASDTNGDGTDDTNDTDDGGGDTPGFTIPILLISIFLAMIYWHERDPK